MTVAAKEDGSAVGGILIDRVREAPVRMRSDDSRRNLLAAVKGRREEIVMTIVTRVHAIDGPVGTGDVEYVGGLRQAIEAAVDHTLDSAEDGGYQADQVPPPLLSQARLAARRGVSLETMLRRYLAGHALLGDLVAEEAERGGVPPGVLRWVLRSQAARTDRVVAAISAAYAEEAAASRPPTSGERRLELVKRLLEGELVDLSRFEYEMELHHLGLVARGPGAGDAVERIWRAFGIRKLIVVADDDLVWAWMGSSRSIDPRRVRAVGVDSPRPELSIGVGEVGEGRLGWRLTHLQAQAALSVAVRTTETVARYADVALLATVMQDELLVNSLRRFYLKPLEEDRDGGKLARETLKAYFGAERNVSSAAAALGIDRSTVTKRLRMIEKRIDNRIAACAAELSIALDLAPSSVPKR